ncbi:MAG: PQQ-binding-like beta-propeller repeat protein [Thermoguttaceae bacterium]|jgi:outer membrane protein assembly factor BamB
MKDDNNYRLATLTAAIAGVFSLVVCALLIYDYSRRGNGDPLENEVYQTLKAALVKQPDNDELKSQIRALDLQLRREYFRQRAFTIAGAVLLLGGVAIFLVSAKTAAALRRELPHPQPIASPTDVESHWTRIGRWAVAGVALAMAALSIVLIFNIRLDIPSTSHPLPTNLRSVPGEGQGEGRGKNISVSRTSPSVDVGVGSKSSAISSLAPEASPSEEEIAKNWPSFRGPGGRGTSAYENIPTEWDASSGKNIRWKTPIPLPGNNSPIVWNDRVFLTGANEKRREVYCFDAAKGKLLWRKEAPGTPQSTTRELNVKIMGTGYAASTAATDGRRVFAIFANGDLAAFDFNGKLAWSKSLGIPDNAYGYASSLLTYKNLLVVQFDQGSRGEPPKSKLFAFDSATGQTVWQTDRPVPNSWPSPIVIHAADRDQIVTAADLWVIAYDPENGQEIWRAKCLGQDIGPSPTFAAGKVFVAHESDALSAIRADGQGDVTATHIVWKGEDGLPDICSPLASEEFVFLLATYGTITCYDTEKGDQLWTEDFNEDCMSSPSMAGKLMYVFAKNGKAWVAEPNRDKCRRVAECNLGEECVTSPAFQDGCFYIRGKNNMFCIGNK